MRKLVLALLLFLLYNHSIAQLGDDSGARKSKSKSTPAKLADLLKLPLSEDNTVLNEGIRIMVDNRPKETIELYTSFLNRGYKGPLGGNIYASLGNAYDISGQGDLAKETYLKGIVLYPSYGGLYLELGIHYARNKQFDIAVDIWKQGISKDPSTHSNYFQISRLNYLISRFIDAAIFSELYLIFEDENQERIRKESEIFYYSVQSLYGFEKQKDGTWRNYFGKDFFPQNTKDYSETDSSLRVIGYGLNQTTVFLRETIKKGEKPKLVYNAITSNFSSNDAIFESNHEGPITIEKIAKYRAAWANSYVSSGNQAKYPNPLVELTLALEKNNLLETYLGYMFRYVDEPSVKSWQNAHKNAQSLLDKWFENHPILNSKVSAFAESLR